MQFHVLHLPGTSDGSETSAPHCIHTQAVQPSVGYTSPPLKAFPIGISPDFSVPDTLLQRDFPISDRLLLLTILCSNFLLSWTLYQTLLRKRENPPSVYDTAHCTWNCRLSNCLACAKLSHKYKLLKVDYKCDLNFWPSVAPGVLIEICILDLTLSRWKPDLCCLSVSKYFSRKLKTSLFRTTSDCSVLTHKPNLSINQMQSHMDLQARNHARCRLKVTSSVTAVRTAIFLKCCNKT